MCYNYDNRCFLSHSCIEFNDTKKQVIHCTIAIHAIFSFARNVFIMIWCFLFCLKILHCNTNSEIQVKTMEGFAYVPKIDVNRAYTFQNKCRDKSFSNAFFISIRLLLILMQRAAPHHNCFNHKRSGWYLLKNWCIFCNNSISFSMLSFWQLGLECLLIIESKLKIKRF